ncbi:MAG: ribosome recycling factor [Deltaproteobacteria bacterium HGW-Deltaproteobacteria-14]|jgi:ribosome recycling factor|nr:MAG: ribosome recycling factor [Deltaproteobacteria bacterium HGW-Deltaproteobacteria-14]
MLDEIFADLNASMAKVVEAFQRDLAKLRTGRANLTMLDGIRVEYYGAQTPLNQVAALNVADPRLITIKPWDKTLLTAIEKAIVSSNLGITPGNDGEIIRLPIPPLTGELRQKLVKQLKKQTEDARIAARSTRRDANDLVKSDDDVTEDEQHRALKEIQVITDECIKQLDAEAEKKEKEIMEI